MRGVRFVPSIALCGTALLIVVSAARAQDNGDSDALPWPVRLGLRSYHVQVAFPTISRVVLVPDGATYLDELSRWSPRGRWPVLFEDDHRAPMFIRRFGPAEVIRRSSVDKPADDALPAPASIRGLAVDAIDRAALEAVVIHAWGGQAERHTLRQTFAAQGFDPPGVVLTSVDDPAWTAAVALAAGRGQPLLWLEGDYGQPNTPLDRDRAAEFLDEVKRLLDECGYEYKKPGDTIDAMTLCGRMSGLARVELPVGAELAVGGEYAQGPRAITDLLGRRNLADRYAFAGWIFGDERTCAYIAMCSLFLTRESVLLVHTYPDRQRWEAFQIDNVAELLARHGFDVQALAGEQAASISWRNSISGGIGRDLILMNSKGNTDYFDLFDQRASPHDVPVLNAPAAVQFVHSWSLRYAVGRDSVGGRWLDHGAYAFVGAVHEPYLGAFVSPALVARRLLSFVPMLPAARWWKDQSPFSGAWKVNTLGDPLMLCPSPQQSAERKSAAMIGADGQPLLPRTIEIAADYGENLTASAADLMRRAAREEDDSALAEAVRSLVLIGRDDLAVQMWLLARREEFADSTLQVAAEAALGALFRAGDRDEFLFAWSLIDEPQDRQRDMVWSLLGPRIDELDDASLRVLAESVRRPMPHVDLDRLAPLLVRRFGEDFFIDIINQELAAAVHDRDREALQSMLDQLTGSTAP